MDTLSFVLTSRTKALAALVGRPVILRSALNQGRLSELSMNHPSSHTRDNKKKKRKKNQPETFLPLPFISFKLPDNQLLIGVFVIGERPAGRIGIVKKNLIDFNVIKF